MQRLGALIWLKTRLWWNGLRSRATVADTLVAVILAVLAAIFSALLTVGLAVITHVGLSDGSAESVSIALQIVFWMIGFMAIVVPFFFGFGQPQIPLGRLLVFPFSSWNLYRISLVASFASGIHIFWYPVVAVVTVVAVVMNGASAILWIPSK